MREKIFAVDLGNKLLKICVGEEDEKTNKIILLTKLSKNIETFADGEIIDSENFLQEVINTIKEIAYYVNEPVKNLILSFSASYFNFQRVKGKIATSEKYVTNDDIKKCFNVAKASLVSANYEIIFEQPINYFLDGADVKIRDPLGMEARNLEVDFLVIQGLKSSLSKIKDFFAKNELKVSFILPNPLPASLIVLPRKDREIGVILVDFGYKIFNLSVFQEGKLIFYQNFKFGVGDIFEDLAIDFGFNVDEIYSLLNNFKKSDEKKKKLKIKIGRQKYSFSQLVKLIEKKFSFYWKKNDLHNLFKKLKEEHHLPAGVYLIGGGSYLPESENIFRKYSGYVTKLGSDLNKNLNEEEKIYLNSLGSLLYYQQFGSRKNFFENLLELLRSLFR